MASEATTKTASLPDRYAPFERSRRARWRIGANGVSRILGPDEGPLARTFHEGPSFVGLEAVMVTAEAIKQVEDGHVALGPVDAVVHLKTAEG